MTADGAPPIPSRRHVLVGLASLAPAAYLLSSAAAQSGGDGGAFMQVSRVITGNDGLSSGIGERIQGLLAGRVPDFAAKLADLATAFRNAEGSRDAILAALSEDQVETALAIARPWYLGYVGDPSSTTLKDDAVFATFLEAQSFAKIVDEVPRPTYPGQNAGWWYTPPPGVEPPPMPDEILSWTFHPGGPSQIAAPSPAWRSYAAAPFPTIDDARAAKPG